MRVFRPYLTKNYNVHFRKNVKLLENQFALIYH